VLSETNICTVFIATCICTYECQTCYTHDVRLSVTLVDFDHIVQQKVDIGTCKIGQCLGYQQAEADPDRSILHGIWKSVKFGFQRQPTARMSRYLSICWASCLYGPHAWWGCAGTHDRQKVDGFMCPDRFSAPGLPTLDNFASKLVEL